MTTKPLSSAALLRKIARLEARLAELIAHIEKQDSVIRENIWSVVDAEMRITQAMSILNGEDA